MEGRKRETMTFGPDPQDLFEQSRDSLREVALRGGGAAVVEFIATLEGFGQRLTLYTMARQVLVMDEGVPGGLDMIGDVADAAIAECEVVLAKAKGLAERREMLRALHMVNFNLAADLADCWPEDEAHRKRRHFERGLEAAEYLLGDMFAGAVAPAALANDYWVRGMHELSLGFADAAHKSWQEALGHATEAARRADMPAEGPSATLQVMLLSGYLGIATSLCRGVDSDAKAHDLYGNALRHLRERQAGGDAEQASFMQAQLEKVRAKYAPGLRPSSD